MIRKDFLRLFDGSEGTSPEGNTAGTGNGGQQSAGVTYTFEQAEAYANARADRASRAALADFYRKQGLSEDEITTAINDFKEKQKAQQPDVSAIQKERDIAVQELSRYKNESVLRSKGVREEDMDYVLFKVGQKVTDKVDFKKAAETFLKENPRFAPPKGQYKIATSVQTGGTGGSKGNNDTINDAIRAAIRK